MLSDTTIQRAIAWQREEPSRRSIKIDFNRGEEAIWAYDYVLSAGQRITSDDDEIRIHSIVEAQERETLARLQVKYGGAS